MEQYGINLDAGIPAGAESMLSAGGILMLSAFIVLIIVVIKRWNGRFINVVAGIFAYSIFVFIFANLCKSVLSLIPSIDQIFSYNTTAYTDYIFNTFSMWNYICEIYAGKIYEWQI